MKTKIFILLLVLSCITKAQTNNNTQISTEKKDCLTKEKIIGSWYQEDIELNKETIEQNGFSLHFSKAKTELNIKKNKSYNFKSAMSMTFNIKALKIYNAKVIVKQVGKGSWDIDCDYILYKTEKNKIEYDIDDELKKSDELYNAILKIVENFSKESEIKKVEHQKVTEISSKIIITDKKTYTRL